MIHTASITDLRRKGLSVAAISRWTGQPPRRVAAELGVMWDGKDAIELRHELADEATRQRAAAERERKLAARQAVHKAAMQAHADEGDKAEQVRWSVAMGSSNWRPVAERPRCRTRVWMRALVLACREVGVDVVDAANGGREHELSHARHIARTALNLRGHTFFAVGLMCGCDHTTVRNSVIRMRDDVEGMSAAKRVAKAMGPVPGRAAA